MKLVFLGTPSEAATCLTELVAGGHEIVRVVTRPDRRRGRGSATSPSPVAVAARELGLEVGYDLEGITELGAELGVVVAYGAIIPSDILDSLAMVNVHFSLLPRWRGAAPVERAILAGDERTGVCIMAVEPSLDTGPVYAQRECAVGDRSALDLRDQLAQMGAEALLACLSLGHLPPGLAQDGDATYAKKLLKGELDLLASDGALEAWRKIRCGPSAIIVGERRVQILSASRVDGSLSRGPGTVHFDGSIVEISLVDGVLALHRVRPAGGREIDAAAWFRGLRVTSATWAPVGAEDS